MNDFPGYNLLQLHQAMKHSAYKVDSLYLSAVVKVADLTGYKARYNASK